MKIVFYDTKPYDRESFERCNGNYPDIEVEYEDADLTGCSMCVRQFQSQRGSDRQACR